MYVPSGLFAILPAIEVALRTRSRRRRRMGRCVACEYDLRGLTEPRCPECATPFDETDTRPQRLIWVRRADYAATWGKAAALACFAVLVVSMWYLLDGVARSFFDRDLITYVSAKTGLAESVAISAIIAFIVTSSFVCSRLLYVRIAFRRVPDLRNADGPLVDPLAGKKSTPQGKGKTAFESPKCGLRNRSDHFGPRAASPSPGGAGQSLEEKSL